MSQTNGLNRRAFLRNAGLTALAGAAAGSSAPLIAATPDASVEALDEWCLSSKLARFKRPRAYAFVERIPKSASGKLLRRVLRDGAYTILSKPKSTL